MNLKDEGIKKECNKINQMISIDLLCLSNGLLLSLRRKTATSYLILLINSLALNIS